MQEEEAGEGGGYGQEGRQEGKGRRWQSPVCFCPQESLLLPLGNVEVSARCDVVQERRDAGSASATPFFTSRFCTPSVPVSAA